MQQMYWDNNSCSFRDDDSFNITGFAAMTLNSAKLRSKINHRSDQYYIIVATWLILLF